MERRQLLLLPGKYETNVNSYNCYGVAVRKGKLLKIIDDVHII